MEDKAPFIISGGIFVMAFLIATANFVSQIQPNGLTSDAFFAGCIAITVAVVGLIGTVIALICQNHSLKKKIGEDKGDRSIHSLIGVGDKEKTLSDQIGVESNDRSLSMQIGVKNGVSLAEQNNEIISQISIANKKTKCIYDCLESAENARKEQQKKFDTRQKDTKKKVEEINEFLQDWEQKTIDVQNLRAELQELQINYNKAIDQISSLTAENKALKHNYELLNAQMAPEMDAPGEDMELGQ